MIIKNPNNAPEENKDVKKEESTSVSTEVNENAEENLPENTVKIKERKSLKEYWNKLGMFKPLVIAGFVLIGLFVLVGFLKVIGSVNSIVKSQSPIVYIEATNPKVYPLGKEIPVKDFEVVAVCENNYRYVISGQKNTTIEISQNTVNRIGDVTTIKVKATVDGKSYTCKADVYAQREEVISWECGFPYKEDVRAVVYDNGELAFEGKGDIVSYQNAYPWYKYNSDDKKTVPITSVTFEETVTPQSLDYYFENMDTLEYCGRIPSSTMSMIGTFINCKSLENGANWTQCSNLTDISYCYQGCESLTYVPAIPQYVKVADYCFQDCTFLTQAPDMQYAVSIESAMGMYKNCTRLNDVLSLPIRLGYGKEMFAGCINLQEMPDIPEGIVTMSNMFNGCKRLKKLTNIPESCINVKYCFANCPFIEGDIEVNANPEYYEGFLQGACTSTVVNLNGPSKMLDVLANTVTTDTFDCVLVNGKKPNKSLVKREQIFDANGNEIVYGEDNPEDTGEEEIEENTENNPEEQETIE